MIEIDKNIPMPERHHGNSKWPWDEMEVGDSFLAEKAKHPSSVQIPARLARNGFEVVKRREDGGVRVWRIK